MDRIKGSIGLKVESALQDIEVEKEIEMLDENGHIQYRKLNIGLLKKYKNPFRVLYLWAV